MNNVMSADGFIAFCQRCNTSNYRGLVLLSGERTAVQQAALVLLAHKAAHDNERAVCDWIADDLPANIESSRQYFRHLHRAKAQQLLGSDLEQVVINSYDGLSPNLLGIISGALRGGGMLFLLTPPLRQWPQYSDPDYARFRQKSDADNCEASQLQGGFLRRFVEKLDEEIGRWSDGAGFIWSAPVSEIVQWHYAELAAPQIAANASAVVQMQAARKKTSLRATQHQLLVVNQIEKMLRQPSAVLLLTADRGRGKTTALGFAIMALLGDATLRKNSVGMSIVLCAPIKANVQHALDLVASLPGGIAEQHQLQFLPPDRLLSKLSQTENSAGDIADLIIIDEAAAIAMPVLHKISGLARRIVFASTTAGYEGSGRGFILRFKALLEKQFQQLEHLTLTAAVRWNSNDLMEPFFNRLLCLAELDKQGVPIASAENSKLEEVEPEDVQIVALSKGDLLESKGLLEAVFAVLVNAHYQTRPDDLRYLLDTPYTRLWVARNARGAIVAALLLCEEGGMRDESLLLEQIASGQRRPRGNMMAQLLSYQTKKTDWCARSSWRVMRIAVLAPYRRCGIAKRLIAAMEVAAINAGCSYWGSLFGFDAGLIGFWQGNNTVPVHLGLHLDKASAARNVAVVRLLPAAGESKLRPSVALLAQRLAVNLPVMQRNYFIELASNECAALLDWANMPAAAPSSESRIGQVEDDLSQLQRFVDAELGIDSIYAACHRLLQNQAAEVQLCNSDGLLSLFLQYAPHWQALAAQLPDNSHAGKRAVQQVLRKRMDALYAASRRCY